MYTLTLFEGVRKIETRAARQGVMRIGRDASADWILDDPDRRISRNHLEVGLQDERLFLRALGSNGVYLGDPPQKVAENVDVGLRPGDCLGVGAYRIVVGTEPSERDPANEATVRSESVSALFDAFCEGAQLDPSQFISDDPVELMREAGAVYRQMITGLNDLLAERNDERAEIGMDRTTIGVRDNNLLKWAPAQRVAVDLLVKKEAAFLAGADAIRAAFEDLKKHQTGTVAGHRSAVRMLLDYLRPSTLAAEARKRALQNRNAAAWDRFVAAHVELERQFLDGTDGVIRRGFAQGYDQSASQSLRRAP